MRRAHAEQDSLSTGQMGGRSVSRPAQRIMARRIRTALEQIAHAKAAGVDRSRGYRRQALRKYGPGLEAERSLEIEFYRRLCDTGRNETEKSILPATLTR